MRVPTTRGYEIMLLAATCWLTILSPALAADDGREIVTGSGIRGGLIVHVGCGDGRLTTKLRISDAYVVHGLDTDAAAVRAARQHILAGNYRGAVSAAAFDGKHLPYVGNLVNLVVCSRRFELSRDEILRVLCPGGVAVFLDDSAAERVVKPWPDDYDQWNHYLHDADNNAVSRDTHIAAPLRHLQWKGSPRYSRHHDKSSSVPVTVTAGGKVFYIMDEGPRASILWAPRWQLVARDAFNGVVLWRKEITQWTDHLWPLKSGPAVTPRRLVACEDRVYVTLDLTGPVRKLDATTGEELRIYAGTEKSEEILCTAGVLYLIVNPDVDPAPSGTWKRSPRTVMAVKESDGTILWQRELPWVAPCSLTIGETGALVCDGSRIVALDRLTGRELWKSEPLPGRDKMPTYFAPTLVAAPGAVLYAGGEDWKEHAGSHGLMTCLDAATGKTKWQRPHLPSGYQSPQDIFVIGDRVWCGSTNSKPGEFDKRYPKESPSTGEFVSYNLETGEPEKTLPRDADCYWFHHRCHRAKATENFFLTSRTGIEMIDVDTGQWSLHHWVRGACLYGIMPANGLIYAPPHPCACYPEAKLTGFNVLAGPRGRSSIADLPRAERLQKGPAYGDHAARTTEPTSASSDWPTFRGNPARSGSTDTAVATDLEVEWSVDIGGRLSQPVAADGTIYVAAVDEHALYAIDGDSGKTAWQFIAGGRIDSPPTLHKGSVLFGSADGYVYCLRAADGALAWRFLAAPCDRRVMAWEQLESVWPVHGSVLVRDDVAYVVAGRSMFLDGGLTLYRLDPLTGNVLSTVTMDENDPATGEDLHRHVRVLDMPVASADILSSEGDFLFMRSQPLDLQGRRHRVHQAGLEQQRGEDAHLFVPNGFLDDQYWHRAFWVYGRSVRGGPGYSATGPSAPCGKIMVLDDANLYVFGRKPQYWRWTTPMEFRLFSVDRRLPGPKATGAGANTRRGGKSRYAARWSVEIPVLVRAMVKAGDTLFVAGPADIVNEEQATKPTDTTRAQLAEQARLFAGSDGSHLWAVSAADGQKLTEIKLADLPVFDGLIAAGGRLFMATTDGKVVCLGAGRASR